MVEIRLTSHHFSPRYAYNFTDLAVKTSRPLFSLKLENGDYKSKKMKPIYHLRILSKSTNFGKNKFERAYGIWNYQRTQEPTRS